MAAISQKEYLVKKYLSGDQDDGKKKKRRKKIKSSLPSRSRIIDDDVDFKSLLPSNLGNTLEEDVGDNDPTVADFIDERPDHIVLLEKFRQDDRWKTLGNKKSQAEHTSRHDTDSDRSPPRIQRHDSDSDQSPQKRQRHDSFSDQSPPRRQRHDSDSDQSPQRRQRHDSDSDQSPPRRQRQDSDSDQSPPRRQKQDSDSDQSPPRRQRQDSDSDQSPPRKRKHSDSNQSPPRKHRHSDSDQSPPRRKGRNSDTSRKSSHVKTEKNKSDKRAKDRKKSRWGSDEEELQENKAKTLAAIKDVQGRAAKTLGGATAGLSSAHQMKHEAVQMKHREDKMFSMLDDESLGRNAKTVYRQKGSGKRRNFKEERELTAEEEAKQAEKAEKYKAWNKGLKQATLQNEAIEEAIHEMSKPLTRTRDDEDLDAALRAQDREGDPMLAFIKKKKTGKDSKKKELPRYKGPEPPPNRFKIWPGYRWDGVDRSNGFEKKVFAKVSAKAAIKEIAYKWSVEDM